MENLSQTITHSYERLLTLNSDLENEMSRKDTLGELFPEAEVLEFNDKSRWKLDLEAWEWPTWE